jgi:bifunctional oligoribonuclease and PAP phosphatase NrnA
LNCFKKEHIIQLKNLINNDSKIVIFAHLNPDGDAIGSTLGLHIILKNLGFQSKVIIPNNAPDFLEWMPHFNEIVVFNKHKKSALKLMEEAELAFCIDFNAASRLGKIEEQFNNKTFFKILIDHHPNPENFCNICFSDTKASSAAELVYEFIKEMDMINGMNKNAAECLLAGIIADTGSFYHNASNAKTYEIVGKLLKYEIDKERINSNIYANFSADRMRLLGYTLNEKMKVFADASSAYISLKMDEMNKFNFKVGDTEGFVNYPLSIKGVYFTTIILEMKDHIKFSFRSKGKFPTNEIAKKYFDGGGHLNASAGRLNISMEEAESKIESIIEEYKNEINKSWEE